MANSSLNVPDDFLWYSRLDWYVDNTINLEIEHEKRFCIKIGKPIYSFTLYEKVKRVTIALKNKDYPILMVSFDIPANHEHIVMNKILPVIWRECL